jgi:indole-3-glycerol phosphate synthase
MHHVIDEILENKRVEVAARKAAVPEDELRRAIESVPSPAGRFRDALAAQRFSLIAEIKRKAPSHPGAGAKGDVGEIAGHYDRAPGVSCLSVLTDRKFFGCGPEDLDFVFDAYQVLEARAWGADAVLLIATLLDAGALADLTACARAAGLEPFVETHEEADLAKLPADAEVIGINSRDLRGDLSTDLGRIERLAPRVPAGKLLVGESGVRTAGDARRLYDAGVRAILVGGGVVFTEDVAAALRELTRDIPS